MTVDDLKARLQAELPELLKQDGGFRQWLEQLIRQTAVTLENFDARFDRMLQEFAADRAEQHQCWEAQNRKWEEHDREWREWIAKVDAKVEEDRLKWDEQNRKWEEKNRVEIDVIIKNGLLILCEQKSSMSNSGMYTFDCKAHFYEQRHQRQAQRKIVTSPMVPPAVCALAEKPDIEVFGYAEDITRS